MKFDAGDLVVMKVNERMLVWCNHICRTIYLNKEVYVVLFRSPNINTGNIVELCNNAGEILRASYKTALLTMEKVS